MSSSPNTYEKANDVYIYDIRLVSDMGSDLSLKKQTKVINIYEDVTSACIRGEIVFTDAQNLIRHFPICGQESVHIKFSTPGTGTDPVEFKLDVVEILERTKSDNGKSELIRLGLVSKQARMNEAFRISQTFRGPIHSMIAKIYKNYLKSDKPVALEPTTNQITYCVPNKRPIETIQWLASRSISGEQSPQSYNFLFFETAKAFMFVSLDSLASVPAAVTYTYSGSNRQSDSPMTTTNYLLKINNIEELNYTKSFNRLNEMNDGLYSSELLVHDITYKYISKTNKNYYKDWNNTNHIEPNPTLPRGLNKYANTVNPKLIVRNRQSGLFESHTSQRYEEFLQNRNISILEYDINKVEITVPGNCKLTCGLPINMEIVKPEPLYSGDMEKKDTFQSGKYLITAVRHFLEDVGTKPTHKCIVQLSRGSLPEAIPDKITFDGRSFEPNHQDSSSGVYGILDLFKGFA